MRTVLLAQTADAYLRILCRDISNRRVGSEGNRAATDFFEAIAASFGFETASPAFDCIDWQQEGANLAVDGRSFEVLVSPYSVAGRFSAPLVVLSTLEELAASDIAGRIVLIRGDLAQEQLMPKNFPFYNPDHHKRIISLLESKEPAAIIAATSRDAQMAGGLYPFPLIEDGDFDIPSVYMTEEEGSRLAERSGQEASLDIRARRIPARACNVIARKGARSDRRVVLMAHIDGKEGTPGALDNATGVTILLLVAHLLADYSGQLGIELLAMNGEDYYSNPGEQQYLALNAGRFDEILMGINLDGIGYYEGRTAYSLYGCPPALSDLIHKLFTAHEEMVEGEAWYQGDHALFVLNQRPALALTSEYVMTLMEVIHTPKDSPENVDPTRLARVALLLRDLLLQLDELQP